MTCSNVQVNARHLNFWPDFGLILSESWVSTSHIHKRNMTPISATGAENGQWGLKTWASSRSLKRPVTSKLPATTASDDASWHPPNLELYFLSLMVTTMTRNVKCVFLLFLYCFFLILYLQQATHNTVSLFLTGSCRSNITSLKV